MRKIDKAVDFEKIYEIVEDLYCEDNGRASRDPVVLFKYVYDEYYDCVLCPHDKVLSYSTTNREGYREYKSKSYVCENCPDLKCCTLSQSKTKVVTQHLWKDCIERAEDIRHSEICPRTFAVRGLF